jgi:hypothetical protein
MRTTPTRLSRRTASRMLDDPTGHARDGRLGEMLSAAARPPADLADGGEERAVAAFRAVAHPDSVPTLGGTSFMTRFTRKVAAVPAAVLAAAGIVLAGGGIALAASQGAVHVPFTGHDNRSSDAPSATAATNPGLSGTAADPSDDATDQSPAASPSATPSPSLRGLCVAYQAGAMEKAATNPAFTALQNAAGGADSVDAYCIDLIGAPTHRNAPAEHAKPTQAATPGHPTTATPTHPAEPTSTSEAPETPSAATH